MDLIYTNEKRVDQGVLSAYALDLSYGADENDFEITLAADEATLESGGFVYIEGTEYGGIVDVLKTSTNSETMTHKGRTWHGILNSKVIEPDSGADYLTVSGDANDVLSGLVNRFGIGGSGELMCGKNLVKSYYVNQVSNQYTAILFTEIEELLPNTEYTLSFIGAAGLKFYLNENIFGWNAVIATGERQSVLAKTKADISKDNGLQYTTGYGWIVAKSNAGNTVVAAFDKVQIELGAVATEYEPYREFYSSPGLFSASVAASGIDISNYRFPRYCKGYDGIRSMLAAHDAKLKIAWEDRSVCLSAVPISDYTESPVDGDIATLTVEQHQKKVNHLICLGKGDLAAREVIHLYADNLGNVGDVQYYTGLDEISDVYDNSNSDNLRSDGIKRLAELRNIDKAEISIFEMEGLTYDIGDIVGATEYRSGIKVAEAVTQKIVKIKNGVASIEYKVGG